MNARALLEMIKESTELAEGAALTAVEEGRDARVHAEAAAWTSVHKSLLTSRDPTAAWAIAWNASWEAATLTARAMRRDQEAG